MTKTNKNRDKFNLIGVSAHNNVKLLSEIEKFNLVWIEEPIQPDDFDGYRLLRSLGKVPIAAGENLHILSEISLLKFLTSLSP